jgi:hypothetical protein
MKTVLDLGAYSGQASVHLVKPGDTWILVDNEQYRDYDGWKQPGTPENATRITCDIMDYHEPADIVVCSNVLYHVPRPFEFLKHLRKLTKDVLYLKTYHNETGEDWTFYDPLKNPGSGHGPTARTIFYRPSHAGLEKALKDAGFTDIKIQDGHELTAECR